MNNKFIITDNFIKFIKSLNKMEKIHYIIYFLSLSFFYLLSFSFGINIISRSQRWADESLRYASNPTYKKLLEEQKKYIENLKKHRNLYKKYLKKQQIEKTRNQYLTNFWTKEFKIDKIIYKINWEKLWWPLQYHYKKTKIVIHHTTNNLTKYKSPNDVKKLLRAIYRRHALKRWWWDIGYNYVIWPFWNIYEWRAWWEGIIWAHAKRNNPASIWIALIGNFNIQKPTKKQIDALIDLLTYLCKKYNINPLQDITWHKPIIWPNAKPPYIKDIRLPTIVWHKDVWHTQCPWKNLYQLLPWIRQQVWKNLNKTKLTSYKTHKTKKIKPTKKINFSNTYFINKKSYLIIPFKTEKIIKCWAKSPHFTILSCKYENWHLKLNFKWKKFLASWKKYIYVETPKYNYKIKLKLIFQKDLDYLLQKLKKKYIEKYHPQLAKYKTKKTTYKITIDEAKKLLNWNISVLLYQLSVNYNYYNIICNSSCKWTIDNVIKVENIKNIKIYKNLNKLTIKINNWKPITASRIKLHWDLIIFKNYPRKSFAWIPWNSFKNEIIIKKDFIKLLNWQIKKQFVVINKLPVKDYLKGIAEVNDQMPQEKNKAMALIIKNYTIFYLKNRHPNIPDWSSYQAIDDARIFQKYVWAWFEKTSRLWQKALKETENEIIVYNWYIPILPYFNCSPWFTWSAKEKFWWTDTPWLQSKLDFYKCNTFHWHWVWLSWKWAEMLARKGINYRKILKWYYDGIKIEKIK